MKKFELTISCASCKWKIESELKSKGYENFQIDMNTLVLSFSEPVNSASIIKTVKKLGYHIEELKEEHNDDLTDEEVALIEDAIRNGYHF